MILDEAASEHATGACHWVLSVNVFPPTIIPTPAEHPQPFT
jgi:hypothetical protein